MKKTNWLSLGLVVLSAGSGATEPGFGLQDYAWQAPLAESEAALQQINLTREIVQGLSHPQAADITVIDSLGQSLPSMLRKRPPERTDVWVDLSFQRFEQLDFAGFGGNLRLEREQRSSGETSRLSVDERIRLTRERPHYLIELNEQQRQLGIRDLQLDWIHEPAGDFLKLDVQVANDIDHWTTVQQNKNLFNKKHTDDDWTTLTGLPGDYRYIRLIPDDQITHFELKSVRARYQLEQPAEVLQLSGIGLVEEERHPGFYRFRQPFNVDATAIRFILPKGYFLSGALYSGKDGFDQKRLIRQQLEQHNIDGMNTQPGFRHRFAQDMNYWFETASPLNHEVELEFHYPPYQLVFINNGQGPFTLVWGNYEVEHHQDRLSKLIAQQAKLDLAGAESITVGSIQEAGGLQRAKKPVDRPWLRWLLWLLLGIGVFITARMAWTLFQDLRRHPPA